MATITLFEYQSRTFQSLGWSLNHPVVDKLDAINQAQGAEVIQITRQGLQARNYVGVIGAGEVTLQILPKIYHTDRSEAEKISSASQNLLGLLSYTHGYPLRDLPVAQLQSAGGTWFELLTRLFAVQLHTLVQRGMERQYVAVNEQLPFLKGRWDISLQLRRPFGRLSFYVEYDEFKNDTALNRLFRHVVEQLLLVSKDSLSLRLLTELRLWLSEVSVVDEPRELESKVHFTRLNAHFQQPYELARLFLSGLTTEMTQGKISQYAFLLDMNMLFEKFVLAFLIRHKAAIMGSMHRDIQIEAQVSNGYLATSDGTRVFQLRPDITIKVAGRPIMVVDTKYKIPDPRMPTARMAESDVYQMLAYVSNAKVRHGLLLYPEPPQYGVLRKRFELQVRTHGSQPSYIHGASLNLNTPLDSHPQPLINEYQQVLTSILREATDNGSYA